MLVNWKKKIVCNLITCYIQVASCLSTMKTTNHVDLFVFCVAFFLNGDWFMQRGPTPMFAREIIYTPYFYLQKRKHVGSINEFSSKTRLSLIDRMTFQLHMSCFFCVKCFDVRGGCWFCWYWWICWVSLFKLSFHNCFEILRNIR